MKRKKREKRISERRNNKGEKVC